MVRLWVKMVGELFVIFVGHWANGGYEGICLVVWGVS